jgi:nitroreductase
MIEKGDYPMNFFELAKERFSVRSFKKDAIEAEKLNMILEAGRVAPTACNKQPQKIYVIQSDEMRAKLATVCKFTFDAPVVLAICYDKEKRNYCRTSRSCNEGCGGFP